jgi:YebC/PmpR family DNA-binding regulatory protein
MGAQWKHAGRQTAANKKGQIIGKLVKEIIVSAKTGGPDPDANFRLRAALEDARKNSVPRDTIERAIKRGAGTGDDQAVYETITYEGFAPHQVPVIVECLTDNRNRTAADIRAIFRKGQLGATGAVAWMFDRKGIVEAHHTETRDPEEAAIEAGADEVSVLKPGEGQPTGGTLARFLTGPTDLDAVSKNLAKAGWNVLTSELSYIAKNFVELDGEKLKEATDFLGEVDDNDDVHRLYVGLKPQE